jgi:hypothetical protein
VNSGVRIRTDRATFDGWARTLSGLALPEELRPAGQSGAASAQSVSDKCQSRPVPPLVAASLALHGCADVAVTLRITMPEGDCFGCFGLAGDLAAGLVRCGTDVEIGLFELGELVEEVIRLVPEVPPPPLAAATGCVRITVLSADAAAPSWQQILVAGESQWRRMQSGAQQHPLVTVSDVHGELAADLRFALADCLAGGGLV